MKDGNVSPKVGLTRRDLLATATGSLALATMAGTALADQPPAISTPRRVLRVAHLTDAHVKPQGVAESGLRACLRHVHALDPQPDLIMTGGDAIMSSLGATEEKTEAQWAVWRRVWAEENRLPVEHCIGNHDCWGWQRSKAGTTGDEPLYGKKWAMKELGLERPYRSFDRAGWHFVVLDSVRERGDGGYQPLLEEDQFAWFEADLAATPATTPILILSHVPIVSVGPFYFTEKIVEDYQFKLIGALLHQDTQRLVELLHRHANVRLCLSGHVHLRDRIVYNGITYVSNGAVSGSWWHGTYRQTPPGYGLVDLFDDGTFDERYVTYDAPSDSAS